MSRKSSRKFKERALQEAGSDRFNSKAKGGRNERVVAKLLSKWVGAKFIRVPMSGGLHFESELLCGDVVCVSPNIVVPWSFETKFYKDYTESDSVRFWKQAKQDAERIDKFPMMLLRKNGWPKEFYHVYMNVGGGYLFMEEVDTIFPKKFKGEVFYTPSDQLFNKIDYKDFTQYIQNEKD